MIPRSMTVLRTSSRLLNGVRCNTTKAQSVGENSSWESKPWRIAAAVSVERLPLITPSLTPMEQKIKDMFDQIEFENSKKCDHEIRHEEDLELVEMKKRGEKIPVEKMNIDTAYDDEERWTKDSVKFAAASRVTESDNTNDTRSIHRALDRSLFLLLKQKDNWTLPTIYHQEGESLRATAERALKVHLGDDFQAQVLGNAPFVHFTLKYSKRIQEVTGARGEKVFIYKAFFKDGQMMLNTENFKDYQWLKRDEMFNLADPLVKKPLESVIYEDEH